MDFTIRKSSESCQVCERGFQSGEDHFSLVRFEETEPVRIDLCVDCFTHSERDPEREFAYWRTKRSDHAKPKRVVDFNTLRELFFRMAEQGSAEYQKTSYLLGLVLLRKRVLRLEEFVTENGIDYLVVTSRERPAPLKIEAPPLVAAEFDVLRERLQSLLDIDLEGEGIEDVGASRATAQPDAHDPEGDEPPEDATPA